MYSEALISLLWSLKPKKLWFYVLEVFLGFKVFSFASGIYKKKYFWSYLLDHHYCLHCHYGHYCHYSHYFLLSILSKLPLLPVTSPTLKSGFMPLPCFAPGMTTSSSSRPATRNLLANLTMEQWYHPKWLSYPGQYEYSSTQCSDLVAGVMYMSNSSSQTMVGGIAASRESEAFPGNNMGSEAALLVSKAGPDGVSNEPLCTLNWAPMDFQLNPYALSIEPLDPFKWAWGLIFRI